MTQIFPRYLCCCSAPLSCFHYLHRNKVHCTDWYQRLKVNGLWRSDSAEGAEKGETNERRRRDRKEDLKKRDKKRKKDFTTDWRPKLQMRKTDKNGAKWDKRWVLLVHTAGRKSGWTLSIHPGISERISATLEVKPFSWFVSCQRNASFRLSADFSELHLFSLMYWLVPN